MSQYRRLFVLWVVIVGGILWSVFHSWEEAFVDVADSEEKIHGNPTPPQPLHTPQEPLPFTLKPSLFSFPLTSYLHEGLAQYKPMLTIEGSIGVDQTQCTIEKGIESYTLMQGKHARTPLRRSFTLYKCGPSGVIEFKIFSSEEEVQRYHHVGIRYKRELYGRVTMCFRHRTGMPSWRHQYEKEYESVYEPTNDEGSHTSWLLPALYGTNQSYILLAESGPSDGGWHGSVLRGQCLHAPPLLRKVALLRPSDSPLTSSHSPWLIATVGTLDDIVRSTFVTDYAPDPPPELSPLPWNTFVKGGKAAWDWWSRPEGTGPLSRQRHFAAAAKEFGWEYVLIDAEWEKWRADIPGFVKKVAKEEGIGTWLWYNAGPLYNNKRYRPLHAMTNATSRAAEFAWLQRIGVVGVKIDFWWGDGVHVMQGIVETLQDAARHHLMVSLHGCTVPRGWSRTYPNLMTMEAVKGAEHYRVKKGPHASDNVRYVYTRNVVGSMDYTPLTFQAAWNNREVTYAHTLALAVVFESGMISFADDVDSFRGMFAQYAWLLLFLRELPTADWQHTSLLSGHPDTHAVVRRVRGRDGAVYMAGITSDTAEVEVTLFPQGSPPPRESTMSYCLVEGRHTEGTRLYHTKFDKEVDAVERSLRDRKVFLPRRGGFVLYPC